MGQRFQVVVQTPKNYWNENNPNNHEGKILIYHFQWLWGHFAIWRLGQFVKGVKTLITKEKKSTTCPLNYEDIVKSALDWVCYKNIESQNNYHTYFEKAQFEFENKKSANWSDLFNKFDNNNGVFFLKINADNSLQYCFWNPKDNEGTNQQKELTWLQYLNDYLGDTERKNRFEKDDDYRDSVKVFESTKLLIDLPPIEKWMIKKKDKFHYNPKESETFHVIECFLNRLKLQDWGVGRDGAIEPNKKGDKLIVLDKVKGRIIKQMIKAKVI